MKRRSAKKCSECGKHPVHAWGLCNSCYQRARREGTIKVKKIDGGASGFAVMKRCPIDPVVGKPLYITPCRFDRYQFRHSLSRGAWPTGAEFEYAQEYHGEVSMWRVQGRHLVKL